MEIASLDSFIICILTGCEGSQTKPHEISGPWSTCGINRKLYKIFKRKTRKEKQIDDIKMFSDFCCILWCKINKNISYFVKKTRFQLIQPDDELLQFKQINSHNFIKIKKILYNTAPTSFKPYWPIIRERNYMLPDYEVGVLYYCNNLNKLLCICWFEL
jgi:hypothetical protein